MKIIHITYILILFMISTANIKAQESEISWGISASVQDAQLDISLPVWTGSNNIIAPTLGVIYMDNRGTDLRLGLIDRFFIKATEKIKPFVGLRTGALFTFPNEGENVIDYIIGVFSGGEYFFSDNFSVGVEAQLNISISDKGSSRFGNPGGVNLNTGTAIFATIYF